MLLRRATTSDFPICKNFYDDLDSHDMLYYRDWINEESAEQETQSTSEYNYFDGLDFPQDEFTLEEFERYFDDNYGRVYVFEDDDANIIAFIRLFKIQGYRWKLEYVLVEEDYQTPEVFSKIMNDLSREKRIKEIDACPPIKSVQKLLVELGYKATNPPHLCYLRKNV